MLDKTVEIFHFSASFREEAQKSNVKKGIVWCFDGGGSQAESTEPEGQLAWKEAWSMEEAPPVGTCSRTNRRCERSGRWGTTASEEEHPDT